MDLSDAVFILSYLFAQGAEPACLDAADANDDGLVDLSDAVFILAYQFAGGPQPPPPFPQPGVDPTDDGLGCG